MWPLGQAKFLMAKVLNFSYSLILFRFAKFYLALTESIPHLKILEGKFRWGDKLSRKVK
jgi:tryptophan-rich sensory protein